MSGQLSKLISLTRSPDDVELLHRVGLWRDDTLGDLLRRHATSRPRDVALIHGPDRTTYEQYWANVARLADNLLRTGVRDGERAAILLPNWPEFPITRLALSECGLISVILNAASGVREILAAIEAADCSLVVAPLAHGKQSFRDLLAILAGRWGSSRVLVAGDEDPPVGVPLGRLMSTGVTRPPVPESFAETRHDADEIDDILFTSGTTGSPKGVLGAQNRWLSMCGNQRRAGGIGPSDIGVILSPVGGNIGYLKSTVLAQITGSRVILVDRVNPAAVWNLVEHERATYLVSVPTITHRLLAALGEQDHRTGQRRAFPHLRMIFNGGAPMPRALAEAARDRLGCFLLTSLGTTEAGAVAGSHLGDTPEQQVATTGSSYPGATIGVLIDGEVRSTGTGLLVSRCAAGFDGYLDDPAATAAMFDANGWLRHNDIVEIRADGHVVFIDRADDVINRGGHKIAPRELEETLLRHPGIEAVAVTGSRNGEFGARVCAVVVPTADVERVQLDQLRSFLSGHGLARHKLPERLLLVDRLPISPAGKVDRRRLAALAADPDPTEVATPGAGSERPHRDAEGQDAGKQPEQ